MILDKKFSELQLELIKNQAKLDSRTCIGHLSKQISNLRKLFDFEIVCLESSSPFDWDAHHDMHKIIAAATKESHRIMEQCLDEILELEGWESVELEIPHGNRQLKSIEEL